MIKVKMNNEDKPRSIGFITRDIDGTLFITHRTSKQYFIKYNAFGFNECLINELIRKGIERIKVFYKSSLNNHVYVTSPNVVKAKGIPYKHEDYESQLLLPLKYFVKVTA